MDDKTKASTFKKPIDDYTVLPIPLRMGANRYYAGKGITICLIDSGFYPHPDLTKPTNRILHILNITNPDRSKDYFKQPNPDSWHGTMTAAVCAGNGYLSDGLYKGIASESNLVLLKVKDENGISTENIAKAIRWAIENKNNYNIRIINISLGDEYSQSYKESLIDQAAEDAVRAGIIVVAAIGNRPGDLIKPPANSPNVISVGGLDDKNTLPTDDDSMYHSTYGITVDGFLKPELIAPAIWLAAPILPETPEYREVHALYKIIESNDKDVIKTLKQEINKTKLDKSILNENSIEKIKKRISYRLWEMKSISPDYMHVDGTSFASPIVCSIIAQMLEASPDLIPRMVRTILFTTATPLRDIPVGQQGHGVINAQLAVRRAEGENHVFTKRPLSPYLDILNQKIVFYYHSHSAKTIALSGEFNRWAPDDTFFEYQKLGMWKIEIPMLPKGMYLYKYIIDGKKWINDPENPRREPDGYGGLNSKLIC